MQYDLTDKLKFVTVLQETIFSTAKEPVEQDSPAGVRGVSLLTAAALTELASCIALIGNVKPIVHYGFKLYLVAA